MEPLFNPALLGEPAMNTITRMDRRALLTQRVCWPSGGPVVNALFGAICFGVGPPGARFGGDDADPCVAFHVGLAEPAYA